MARVISRYSEALLLAENVHDEADASDSAALKRGLGIMHFDSALHLESEKGALLCTEASAVHTKKNTKEKTNSRVV